MTIKSITMVAALALAVAGPAQAAGFNFEYRLNTGELVTGSFTGDKAGNLVTNISDISVALNGTSFSGTLAAYRYTGYNGPGGPNNTASTNFVLNAATVSFDPLLNNFLFINTVPILQPDEDLFYIFPWTNGGDNQVATQVRLNGVTPNFYNGNYVPGNWSLKENSGPGGVPEPATWLMLIGGFGLVGVVSRRRVGTVAA